MTTHQQGIVGGYDRRVLRLALGGVAWLLLWGLAGAQPDLAVRPEPSPTDAVQASRETFTAMGKAPQSQGAESARFAALLDGYQNLVIEGLEAGLLSGGWGPTDEGFRLFRLDQDHPNPQVMAWLTRAKIQEERQVDGFHQVLLESPANGELSALEPAMRAVVTQDVDRDGLSDVVSVGYDGSVYVRLGVRDRQPSVLARSPSYAAFELVAGPGLQRVRAVLPTSVGSIEPAGPGQARVVLELEALEMVNGKLLGRATEQREVLVSLAETEQHLHFAMEDPPDFARLYQPEVELRGRAIALRRLESLEIRHNGELTWESPEGLNLSALQFNLARPLDAGWNLFRLTARDQEGLMRRRDLWLQSASNTPTAMAASRRRAVLWTLDQEWREKKVLGSLQKAGFQPSEIALLDASKGGVAELLGALEASDGASDLLLYLEAFSQPGELIDGKTLLFGKEQLTASDLALAFRAGGYQRVVVVLHTELDASLAPKPSEAQVWHDTARFLERLGDGGRLAVANLESQREPARQQRLRSRERLLQALEAPGGSDLGRLLDRETPARTVFRGWMFGPPVLGGARVSPSEP